MIFSFGERPSRLALYSTLNELGSEKLEISEADLTAIESRLVAVQKSGHNVAMFYSTDECSPWNAVDIKDGNLEFKGPWTSDLDEFEPPGEYLKQHIHSLWQRHSREINNERPKTEFELSLEGLTSDEIEPCPESLLDLLKRDRPLCTEEEKDGLSDIWNEIGHLCHWNDSDKQYLNNRSRIFTPVEYINQLYPGVFIKQDIDSIEHARKHMEQIGTPPCFTIIHDGYEHRRNCHELAEYFNSEARRATGWIIHQGGLDIETAALTLPFATQVEIPLGLEFDMSSLWRSIQYPNFLKDSVVNEISNHHGILTLIQNETSTLRYLGGLTIDVPDHDKSETIETERVSFLSKPFDDPVKKTSDKWTMQAPKLIKKWEGLYIKPRDNIFNLNSQSSKTSINISNTNILEEKFINLCQNLQNNVFGSRILTGKGLARLIYTYRSDIELKSKYPNLRILNKNNKIEDININDISILSDIFPEDSRTGALGVPCQTNGSQVILTATGDYWGILSKALKENQRCDSELHASLKEHDTEWRSMYQKCCYN